MPPRNLAPGKQKESCSLPRIAPMREPPQIGLPRQRRASEEAQELDPRPMSSCAVVEPDPEGLHPPPLSVIAYPNTKVVRARKEESPPGANQRTDGKPRPHSDFPRRPMIRTRRATWGT